MDESLDGNWLADIEFVDNVSDDDTSVSTSNASSSMTASSGGGSGGGGGRDSGATASSHRSQMSVSSSSSHHGKQKQGTKRVQPHDLYSSASARQVKRRGNVRDATRGPSDATPAAAPAAKKGDKPMSDKYADLGLDDPNLTAKQRRRRKERRRNALKKQQRLAAERVMGLGLRDLDTQATVMWKRYTRYLERQGVKLTPLEQAEVQWSKEHFVPATAPGAEPVGEVDPTAVRDLGALPFTLKRLFSGKENRELLVGSSSHGERAHGTPVLLVLTYSANRATDIIRAIRKLRPKTVIAKLFARHMKVQEQAHDIDRDLRIAVGTPNRVLKLCEMGALDVSELRITMLDMVPTPKQFTVVDLPQVSTDVFRLMQQFIIRTLHEGENKLCLF